MPRAATSPLACSRVTRRSSPSRAMNQSPSTSVCSGSGASHRRWPRRPPSAAGRPRGTRRCRRPPARGRAARGSRPGLGVEAVHRRLLGAPAVPEPGGAVGRGEGPHRRGRVGGRERLHERTRAVTEVGHQRRPWGRPRGGRRRRGSRSRRWSAPRGRRSRSGGRGPRPANPGAGYVGVEPAASAASARNSDCGEVFEVLRRFHAPHATRAGSIAKEGAGLDGSQEVGVDCWRGVDASAHRVHLDRLVRARHQHRLEEVQVLGPGSSQVSHGLRQHDQHPRVDRFERHVARVVTITTSAPTRGVVGVGGAQDRRSPPPQATSGSPSCGSIRFQLARRAPGEQLVELSHYVDRVGRDDAAAAAEGRLYDAFSAIISARR